MPSGYRVDSAWASRSICSDASSSSGSGQRDGSASLKAKATRAPNYPDFHTIAETVPGFTSGGWFGFVAPAKVPKEIIVVLNREANAAMKSIVRRDSGDDWLAHLKVLAAQEGIEITSRADAVRFDKRRAKQGKKQVSNDDWESPSASDALGV